MKNFILQSCLAKSLLIGSLVTVGAFQTATAGVIFSATGATINSGGSGFGSINDTFNQKGLLSTYVSDVTLFGPYIATNPLHSSQFSGFEWFSNVGSTAASVTYDFGVIRAVDAVALWNEEAAGIGLLNLLYSTDGTNFFALLSGLIPTDNVSFPTPYSADVFAFAAVNARFMRFDMSGCPQQPAGFNSCAIGEVAFREPMGNNVPEPASLALLGIGLAGLGAMRRRKV